MLSVPANGERETNTLFQKLPGTGKEQLTTRMIMPAQFWRPPTKYDRSNGRIQSRHQLNNTLPLPNTNTAVICNPLFFSLSTGRQIKFGLQLPNAAPKRLISRPRFVSMVYPIILTQWQ